MVAYCSDRYAENRDKQFCIESWPSLGVRVPEQLVGSVLGSLYAASWVRSSSRDNSSDRGGFPLGVNMGSDFIPPKLLRMRV